MKKCKITILSIAMLAMILMAGCNLSNAENTESQVDTESETGDRDAEEFFVDAGVPDDELSLMQKVLFNKEEYNDGQKIADVEGIYYNPYGRRITFWVVDMDHDGKDEICIVYATGDILILHEIDGRIYGYEHGFRGFNPAYTDGTFAGSSGAAYGEFYGNVSFTKDEFRYEGITGIEFHRDGNTTYYKNGTSSTTGVEISKEEYDQIMSQYEKIVVEYFDFTIENILEYVE